MAKGTVEVLNTEREFRVEELFFSTTDAKGIVCHGNGVFTRISGYSEEELFGAPHSIIRHPDMPRAVFQLLWDTIQAGGTIAAYVKNLAKDGRYYWVLAVVMPCDGGYLSVRLKPTSPILGVVRTLYSELLQLERQIETEPKRRREAIEATTAKLLEELLARGFKDYNDFMQQALVAEITSRHDQLEPADDTETDHQDAVDGLPQLLNHCRQLDEDLQTLFHRLEEFRTMNEQLSEKSASVLETADDIRLLALNASIASSGLGPRGASLQTVSKSLGASSMKVEDTIVGLSQQTGEIVSALSQLIFDVAATKLQSEIGRQFIGQMLSSSTTGDGTLLQESLQTLLQTMGLRTAAIFDSLSVTDAHFGGLEKQIQTLVRNNKLLRFVQFAGEKEAASWSDLEDFRAMFSQAHTHIEGTYKDCLDLGKTIENVRGHIAAIRDVEPQISDHIQAFREYSLA
ncbi:MAG TPA: PAS domain-containing protein [Candidatus Latescibacteria bacterium]|jgi:aerotaxis receptor|nr:PAS domain-containing protein [Candidatus Latescibacterota bacterium]HJP29820.1 PAS domain-containing protein [Candidatus Latescibacterota bacterium]